jgi:hypothetical protein
MQVQIFKFFCACAIFRQTPPFPTAKRKSIEGNSLLKKFAHKRRAGKAALARAHSKTWRTFSGFLAREAS